MLPPSYDQMTDEQKAIALAITFEAAETLSGTLLVLTHEEGGTFATSAIPLSTKGAQSFMRQFDLAVRCIVSARQKSRAGVYDDPPERRQIDRTPCGVGDCKLPREHAGPHAGACGCINGCKAWDCPNL